MQMQKQSPMPTTQFKSYKQGHVKVKNSVYQHSQHHMQDMVPAQMSQSFHAGVRYGN